MKGYVVRKGDQHYAVTYERLDPITRRDRLTSRSRSSRSASVSSRASPCRFEWTSGGYMSVPPSDNHPEAAGSSDLGGARHPPSVHLRRPSVGTIG